MLTRYIYYSLVVAHNPVVSRSPQLETLTAPWVVRLSVVKRVGTGRRVL